MRKPKLSKLERTFSRCLKIFNTRRVSRLAIIQNTKKNSYFYVKDSKFLETSILPDGHKVYIYLNNREI